MLPASRRLSRKEIHQLPNRLKTRLNGSFFDLVVFPFHKPKFAFLISRKVVAKANKRNALKRKISLAIEQSAQLLSLPKAVLIIVKSSPEFVGVDEIRKELETLLLNGNEKISS